jgi:hypothetical protein
MFGIDMGTILPCWIRIQSLNHGTKSSFSTKHHAVNQISAEIWTGKCGGNGMMMDTYSHPLHMKAEDCQTHLICWEWMWEPFNVGLEPYLTGDG